MRFLTTKSFFLKKNSNFAAKFGSAGILARIRGRRGHPRSLTLKMRIEELQFGAMMVTAFLTLTLVTQVPRRVVRTVDRARWLIVAAMVMLFIQFLVQYVFGFRSQGITQGVAINLLFFIPVSCLLTVALLYLQRHGTVPRSVWLIGGLCWGGAILLIVMTADFTMVDGHLLLTDSPALKTAEYIAALCFSATQIWFCYLHFEEYRKLKQTLDSYSDDDSDELLRWMQNSVMLLATAAVFVPIVIFQSGYLLGLFSVLFFGTIYYCIIRFYRYSVGATPQLVDEAGVSELSADTPSSPQEEAGELTMEKAETNKAMLQHVEEVVVQWTANKGYLHKKATLQRVADEMNVPRSQLSAWLKATDRVFNQWINNLRIEEAKLLLREHTDWSNDSIADLCGFGSRSYFQTIFKENTGMTPAQFVESSPTD